MIGEHKKTSVDETNTTVIRKQMKDLSLLIMNDRRVRVSFGGEDGNRIRVFSGANMPNAPGLSVIMEILSKNDLWMMEDAEYVHSEPIANRQASFFSTTVLFRHNDDFVMVDYRASAISVMYIYPFDRKLGELI